MTATAQRATAGVLAAQAETRDAPAEVATRAATGPGTISVRGLWHEYGSKVVLERVSLDVAPGSFVSITGPSGCDWLVARRVKAVGYDYPPDQCIRDTVTTPRRRRPSRDEYTTHATFFPAGITVIEYLTNLDAIGAPRCRFIALPLKIEGADGSPVRAIALEE